MQFTNHDLYTAGNEDMLYEHVATNNTVNSTANSTV